MLTPQPLKQADKLLIFSGLQPGPLATFFSLCSANVPSKLQN
jgi:hypothetical protein